MNQWLKRIKVEMDVEFFSAVHWVAIAWCYALIRFLFHKDGIGFVALTQMGLIAYAMAWGQKILYVNERIYKRIKGMPRRIAWILIPMFLLIVFQFLFHWFQVQERVQFLLFDLTLFLFYVIMECLIYYVYKEDTKVLNELLKEYQKDQKDQKEYQKDQTDQIEER